VKWGICLGKRVGGTFDWQRGAIFCCCLRNQTRMESEHDTINPRALNIRRGGFLGLVATVIATTSLIVWVLVPHEPSYQGRGLSAWLSDFEHEQVERRAVAADAVRHIGTDAVPFLVKRLGYNPDVLRRKSRFALWKRQFLEWVSRHSFGKVSPPRRPPNPSRQAMAGLDALGTAAKDALPALEKLLNETPPDPQALYIVARIGSAGVPMLKKSLTNSASSEAKLLRLEARVCLDMIESHSETLYPTVEFGPDASYYDRRVCEFNVKVIRSAFQDYRAQHPEMVFPKGAFDTPPPSVPP
jgi:hypothetical protein